MRLVLVGAHSTGKTTLLQALKLKHKELIIKDGISRPIHKCSAKLGLYPEETQTLISELTQFIWESDKDIPNLCQTRSPLDCISYSKALGYKQLTKEGESYLSSWAINNTIFCYIPIEFPIVDDGVRPTDVEFQKKIDDNLKFYLDLYKIKYERISGTIEERVLQIENILLNYEKSSY